MTEKQAGAGALALDGDTIQQFAAGMRGELLRPGDEGFDAARKVWNGMIDKSPALIARCAGVGDVVSAVNFARTHDLPVAVRGGGHNVTGNAVCSGGLVIDLSSMRGIRVDPARRIARAEGGVTWGEFDHETQTFGLATTGGVISTTGLGGLTQGGGIGYLIRKHGLACDNLLSVDVVTADGRFLTASAEENADLFWGVRGGGGNFGVVTSLEFRLHPVGPMVLGGMVVHPASRGEEVLRFYREFTQRAPDELSLQFGVLTQPDGELVVGILGCYAGPVPTAKSCCGRCALLVHRWPTSSSPCPIARCSRCSIHFFPRAYAATGRGASCGRCRTKRSSASWRRHGA